MHSKHSFVVSVEPTSLDTHHPILARSLWQPLEERAPWPKSQLTTTTMQVSTAPPMKSVLNAPQSSHKARCSHILHGPLHCARTRTSYAHPRRRPSHLVGTPRFLHALSSACQNIGARTNGTMQRTCDDFFFFLAVYDPFWPFHALNGSITKPSRCPMPHLLGAHTMPRTLDA